MRSRTATWFEAKIKYEKVMDDGTNKKVTETYVLSALTYTEAEKRIVEKMSSYIRGVFEVDLKKAVYSEVFFMSDAEKSFSNQTEDLLRAVKKGDEDETRRVYERSLEEQERHTDTRWYKAKLQFITIDEKTEKEKRANVLYLVEACSLHNAIDNIDKVMQGTMIDYVQANVGETKIVDVFEYANEKDNKQ